MAETEDIDEQAKEWRRWDAELGYALKDEKYKKWLLQSEKIIKRYRDERKDQTAEYGKRRYNILWSNVQTLGPAVYGKMPKPIAERRFLDRDPAARLASLLLERPINFMMETCGFHEATDKAVLDYLLPGLGQIWLRYEPEFESEEILQANTKAADAQAGDSPDASEEDGSGEPVEKLKYERVCFDYVYFRDFLWGPSRSWCEVPWVARRSWLDKTEAKQQFGEEIAAKMVFGDPKNRDWSVNNDQLQLGKSKKAEVWEIWNKPDRCVYFISHDTPDLILKEVDDDPLKLAGFWPCPEPLFTTQTNDTLVPVPDYIEYQDQASELDTLTQRIAVVTTAIRANGTYNGQFPALRRLFEDGQDNKLIPVDDWAAFAEKGGLEGAISLVPMDMLIKVLTELYAARDKVKEDIYEITGMSDIIRGATDPNETMGAQKIKARFASGRLGARQKKIAIFCADLVKLAAEIVAEVFSPETIRQMSGLAQMDADAIEQAVKAVKPPQIPQAQPGQPPDPMAQQQMQMQFQRMQQQAEQQTKAERAAQFAAAMKLLHDEKLRGFRVEIETDSTLADDMDEDRTDATEFVSSTLQALESAQPLISAAPELAKPIGEMLLWALRKFRVGRTLEAAFEDAIDKLEARIEAMKDQPPPPSPEMIQAQADMQVAQAKAGEAQTNAQAEAGRAQADIQLSQAKMQTEQAKLQGSQQAAAIQAKLDETTLQLDAMKAAAANDTDMKKAKLGFMQAVMVAQIAAGQATDAAALDAQIEAMLGFARIKHEEQMQAADQQHQQGMQASQQEHQQTLQDTAPKPAKGAA